MAYSLTRRINIYINGKEVEATIKGIRDRLRELRNILSTTELSPEARRAAMREQKHLNTIMNNFNTQMRATNKSLFTMKGLANAFNKFAPVFFGTMATLAGLSRATRRAAEDFAEFDEHIADVMKVTKSTREDIMLLNKELQRIDTRTAQNTLLEFAWVAGKLGIHARSEVVEFVRAADQIAIALAKDLGGSAEEAIRAVGKAVEIFNLREIYGIEQAMLKVGSAINELGMASTASEGYLIKFLEKAAGIAPLANVSIENVLAIASVLDQFAQQSEVSGTAYSKLMVKMATETEAMARIMGVSIQDYVKLFAEDANEAMIRLFEAMGGEGTRSFTEVVNMLEEGGLTGQRMTAIMGVLVKNVENLRQQTEISNKAFKEGTSVTNEFGIKNQTATAIIEKKQKELKALRVELGEKLMPVYIKSIDVYKGFITTLSAVAKHVVENIRVYATVTTTLLTLITVYKVLNALKGFHKILVADLKHAYYALTFQLFTFTGQTQRAAAAQAKLNVVASANPWGALASVIASVTVGLITLLATKKKISEFEKLDNEANKRIREDYAKETSEVDRLRRIIEDETASRNYRLEAVNALREIIPDYHAELDTEGKLIKANTTAIDEWNEATLRSIRIQAKKDQYAQAYLALEEKRAELRDIEPRLETAKRQLDQFPVGQTPTGGIAPRYETSEYRRLNLLKKSLEAEVEQGEVALARINKEIEYEAGKIEHLKAELTPTRKEWERFLALINKTDIKATADFSERAEELAIQALKQKRLHGEYLDNETQFELDLAKLKLRFLKGRLADPNLDPAGEEYLKLRGKVLDAELDLQIKHEQHLKKLQTTGVTDAIEAEMQRFEQKKRELGLLKANLSEEENATLQRLQEEHQTNLDKIDAKAIKEHFDKRKKAFDNHLSELHYQNALELEQFTDLEQAKEYLAQFYSQQELDQLKTLYDAKKLIAKEQERKILENTKIFYQAILDDLRTLMDTTELDGLIQADDIISQEEADEITRRLTEVYNALANILGKQEEIDKPSKNTDQKPRRNLLHVDMLGFRPDDWSIFFDNFSENVERTMTQFELMGMALKAFGNAWRDVNNYISTLEERRLQEQQRNYDAQKDILDRHLAAGLLTQEAYNQRLSHLDKKLEREKAIIARKGAKRARNIAIFEAALNTAMGITNALTIKPAWAIPLMVALVSGIGLVQMGAIAATPLPDIPGYAKGGYVDVRRKQDRRRYHAYVRPSQRGFIDKPTILVGEDKPEYVLSNNALQNPYVQEMIDFVEHNRLNQNIPTANTRAVAPFVSARATGGFMYQNMATIPYSAPQQNPNQSNISPQELYTAMITTLNRLNQHLDNGLSANINYQEFRRFEDKVKYIEDTFNIG